MSIDESKPVVAIIVPVYNCERYLRECLNSLFDQKYTNFLAFLIDDGSTDGSGEILNEFAERDSRFKVFYKRNGGVSSARNLALVQMEKMRNFDLVCFLDSDDRVSQNYVQAMVDAYKITNSDIVFIGTASFDQTGVYGSLRYAESLTLDQEEAFEFIFSFGNIEAIQVRHTRLIWVILDFRRKLLRELGLMKRRKAERIRNIRLRRYFGVRAFSLILQWNIFTEFDEDLCLALKVKSNPTTNFISIG